MSTEKLEALHARMTRLVDEAHRLGGVENAAKAKAEAVAKANESAMTNGSVAPTEKRRLNSGAAKRAATQAAKEAIRQAVDAVYGASILTTDETAAVAVEPQATTKKPSNADLARAAIARQPERITNAEIRQANPNIQKELLLGAIYALENAKEIQKVDRGTWQALPALKSVPASIYQHLI